MSLTVIVAIALFLLLVTAPWTSFFARLGEAIEKIKENLNGGPRPPTHPLMADDSWILTRKRSHPETLPRKRG